MPPKRIYVREDFKYKFSICTLASNPIEYQHMVDSFLAAGFSENDCEYLYADNSLRNDFEAFNGINRFLREAQGEFVVICHQDVIISIDDRNKLEQLIDQVTRLDDNWAILGNAGINNMYNTSMVITEADLRVYRKGILPSKVISLDENFLLVKSRCNLAVSADLKGFHMYGTDICLIAKCLGYTSYAIDFNLIHKGVGNVDQSFYDLSTKLQAKYSAFFRGRYMRTTITRFFISSSQTLNLFMDLGIMKSISRLYYKIRFLKTGKI